MKLANRTTGRIGWALVVLAGLVAVGGCVGRPGVIPPENRRPLDRSITDTAAGTALLEIANGFTAPTAICFDPTEGDHKNWLLVAESGAGGGEARIFAIKPDHTLAQIYPQGRRIPFLHRGFHIYGPIGGMVVVNGKIILSHRDRNGMGMITALDYDGAHTTLVADLPAQGDYSVTDIAVHPVTGRLYFGVGAATNSGVVGLDNWQVGWVNDHPRFCDLPLVMLKLLGYRFDTKNPRAGIWGGADIAVTAPMQAFNSSNQTRIQPAPNAKPTSAIYSCSPSGGDLKVEAHGIRLPRGLAFDTYGQLYFTNNGMELRGTRPVKDDPDVLLKFFQGGWYGFPDYSADLYPISDPRFQPPIELIIKTGYPDLSFLIDHRGSKLTESPDAYRDTLVFGVFPSQSGAAKLDFVPETGPFKEFGGEAIVALCGDRAPFATSGRELVGPTGYKVVAVNVDRTKRQVRTFISNTSGQPASRMGGDAVGLERPIDVKFGPDGALYVLDFGPMTVVNGQERVATGGGRIFKLVPLDWASAPASHPTTAQAP